MFHYLNFVNILNLRFHYRKEHSIVKISCSIKVPNHEVSDTTGDAMKYHSL